jgi:hypothetical protein
MGININKLQGFDRYLYSLMLFRILIYIYVYMLK